MFICLICYCLFILQSLVIVNSSMQPYFMPYQTFTQKYGMSTHSFTMGDYGYFISTGTNFSRSIYYIKGYQKCDQEFSRILKYDNKTQQFVTVYNFSRAYLPLDIYPFTIDGNVRYMLKHTQTHTHCFYFPNNKNKKNTTKKKKKK